MNMEDATEFGKKLLFYGNEKNIRGQNKLAKVLEVSTGTMSNYITGKAIPDIDFLLKCIKIFEIENKDIPDFFIKYFATTAEKNKKIIIDTRYIESDRIETLVKIVTILMLHSGTSNYGYPGGRPLYILTEAINKLSYDLKDKIVLQQS